MKVLWLSWKDRKHPLAGGAEVVTAQLARRLVQDGHEFILLTSSFAGAPHEELVDGYKVIRVGNRYSVYHAAATYYKQHLRGWADVVIEEVNTIPFFARFYVRERRFLFIHQLCRKVWFYEMTAPLSWLGYLAEPLYVRLLHKDPVITISHSTKQDLLRYGFRPAHITIISEGIELEPLQQIDRVKKYPQPTMLSLGSMRSMKRTLDQVKAFELAKKDLPTLGMQIAGDASSPYGQKVLAYIQQSPYAKDINYLGRVSYQQKQELMQQAHIITVTSVKEGWGLIVTEAASQGTPAVVYDVDGLRDSVRHNKTGLVTAENPAALAAGVVSLLQDSSRYKQLRQNAWQWSKQITFEQSYQDFKRAVDMH